MLKRLKQFVFVVAALVVGFAALMLGRSLGWSLFPLSAQAMQPGYQHHSAGLRIEQVRQLSDLVVLSAPISDVQTSTLSGFTGGVSAVIIVRGDAQIATDLDQARFTATDAETHTAELTLAQPRVVWARLDHDKTRVYRVDRSGLWALLPGSTGEGVLLDRALADAQKLIGEAANRPELLDQARRRAETVLGRFCTALGWTVQIKWSADPAAGQSTASAKP